MTTKQSQPQSWNFRIADAVRQAVRYSPDDSDWWLYVRLPFGWNPRNPDQVKS